VSISSLSGKVPVGVCPPYSLTYGSRLYLYPSSFLTFKFLYGYNVDIIGSFSSTLSNGTKIEIVAFGIPYPPLATTLPATTNV